ncbi:Trk system potassium transporter TrkA [Bilifractor sp. HCP3S3_D3]|uniref:Trk system potassium transporter TrkA n=1 Tax=Bilifractor sp. HCP3S3_D3 TaxID=3438907 RepID=UPI002A8DECBA|nr:Trk system potassium transporter TrkA [Bilifractor sp.]
MQIIVVGCGKVGRTLVAQLSKEGHNITVVDTNAQVVRDVSTIYDVMGITGNGTSYNVLCEADLEHTDMVIAVTESDEVNLLVCVIAKQKADCYTIARVRNPVYSEESSFLRSELHLSMTINPELEAAREMAHLMQYPSAVEIDSFAGDRISLMRFKVPAGSSIIGSPLKEVSQRFDYSMLICIAQRGNEIVIPNGDFTPAAGDVLTVILEPLEANAFFRKISVPTNRVKNCTIIGGGEISYYLTKILLKNGIDVKIIEKNPKRCSELNDIFPQANIDCADGSDQEILMEENLENTDAFVACTGIDEVNAILSLFAQEKVRKKVITKVNHVDFNEVIDSLQLDSVVNPKLLTTQRIIQYVRAANNSLDSNMETLYRLMNGRVEAMGFRIQQNSKLIGIPLIDMPMKTNVLIAGILRKGRLIIPGGQDMFQADDHVIIVTTHSGFDGISDIIAK